MSDQEIRNLGLPYIDSLEFYSVEDEAAERERLLQSVVDLLWQRVATELSEALDVAMSIIYRALIKIKDYFCSFIERLVQAYREWEVEVLGPCGHPRGFYQEDGFLVCQLCEERQFLSN